MTVSSSKNGRLGIFRELSAVLINSVVSGYSEYTMSISRNTKDGACRWTHAKSGVSLRIPIDWLRGKQAQILARLQWRVREAIREAVRSIQG